MKIRETSATSSRPTLPASDSYICAMWPKLCQCKVTATRSLSTFLAAQAHSHMSSYNHGHVIGLSFMEKFNQFHQFGFAHLHIISSSTRKGLELLRLSRAITNGQGYSSVVHLLHLSDTEIRRRKRAIYFNNLDWSLIMIDDAGFRLLVVCRGSKSTTSAFCFGETRQHTTDLGYDMYDGLVAPRLHSTPAPLSSLKK